MLMNSKIIILFLWHNNASNANGHTIPHLFVLFRMFDLKVGHHLFVFLFINTIHHHQIG